jgi:hypothetical protein
VEYLILNAQKPFSIVKLFCQKVKLKVSKKCYNEIIFENLNCDTFEKFGKNPSDFSMWFKEIAKKYRTYFVCSQIWVYLSINDCPLWLHDQTVQKETSMPNFNTVVLWQLRH